MKIVKKVNNNVALGLDGNGQEVVVFGKGIGFPEMPYELTDLSKISRTFYGIENKYYNLLKEIPDTVFLLVSRMLDVATGKIGGNLNPNLVFVLADHINFAIEREKKGMFMSLPYSYELEYSYPELTDISRWMVDNINKKMSVHLGKGEITSITMHILGALEGKQQDEKEAGRPGNSDRIAKVIKELTDIVEDFFHIQVDKKSFHYFRFKNHLNFLVQRKERGEILTDPTNKELYENLKSTYPGIHECVNIMAEYLCTEFGEPCSEDECMYLMLHVRQLYNKEEKNK